MTQNPAMMLTDLLPYLAIALCLCLSFFFSGSETALTASSRARMHRMEKTGDRNARRVNRLLDARERLIGAILIGNNLANTAIASLTTAILLTLVDDELGIFYATLIASAVIIVFSEILPKTIAINWPDRVSLIVARPISMLVALLGPITLALERFIAALLRLVGLKIGDNKPVLSAHEELRGAVDLFHQEGSVAKQDRDMLGGLLDLAELDVSDVMIHRTKMAAINADDAATDIVEQVLASQYTRLPLWRGTPENIVGILHAKDLLRALRAAGGDADKLDVITLARPPWFVPDTTTLDDQLRAFRRRKTHFALVVDEYGEVMGLVTLEDILEEIVGDISDEHDIAIAGVRPQPDGSVNVDGSVPIRDVNRVMDWRLPDDEATTVAGLVIHESRSIPEPGQSFTFHGFRFQVQRRVRNRLTAIKITPLPKARPVTETPAGQA
jgi:Mg2+/Co2+ transporter CorB